MKKIEEARPVGCWWADNSIEVVEIDGHFYALNGHNGMTYGHCWKCWDEKGGTFFEASEEEYEIREIFEENEDGEFIIVGYELV